MSLLTELYEQIALCQKCDIAKSRTTVVPGEGAEDADIMFIGEAPGWHEDQQGRPFVGPAGQFLDRLLASIDLNREQVYIANVIKCRPTGNRDPLPSEITNCQPWLASQIEIIKPRMIVTLGRYSMARYFLHQGNLKQTIEVDMSKIPALLAETDTVEETTPQPQQMNMFEVQ